MFKRTIYCAGLSFLLAVARATEPSAEQIYQAVRVGTAESVRQLLEKGVPLEHRDTYGNTLLMSEAIYGDLAAVELLLDRGADVNATNSAGVTALMRAAGDPAKIKLLVARGADVNARSSAGNTPLILAARARGSAESLKLLLDRGAAVNVTNVFGATALMCATAASDLESVRLLVKRGADVNAHSRGSEAVVIWGGGRSPLAWAAYRGETEIAKFLIRSGAEVNSPEGFGSALSQAAWADDANMAALLLKHGADPRQKDITSGFTPLHWAANSDRSDARLVKNLLKHGADPNAAGGEPVDAFMGIPQTPLLLASKRGETEVVRFLRSAGAEEKPGNTFAPEIRSGVDPNPEALRLAVAKAVSPLVETARFSKGAYLRHSSKQDCVSCHQQYIPLAAFGFARAAGAPVDAGLETEILQMVRRDNTNRYEQTAQATFHPEPVHSYGYLMLAFTAQNQPPSPEVDVMVNHLLIIQGKEGQWHNNLPRPPIQSSDIAATALAINALTHYGFPARSREIDHSIERARKWLANARPETNEERAYQLLGLSWAGERPEKLSKLAVELQREQRSNGGWAQLRRLEPDAYATGLTLFALLQTRSASAEDGSVQRGFSYLLSTQASDGTWHVRARAFPFQPTMRSGFPYSRDSWVSAAGSSWATMALSSALNSRPIQLGAR